MKEQMQAAKDAMINWLSNEHELGKAPTRIECVKEFDYRYEYDMTRLRVSFIKKYKEYLI